MVDKIIVPIELNDGGSTARLNKDAAALKSQYDGIIASANRTSTAVRAAAAPSGMGETKTARSIGAGAGTGSSASDFAAQAQGLGGLVHLYATFAANIYAASAAFNALKEAMNVVHLVQGMDQLSAASGKSLGTLAKQLNSVTDGALSMQQSMNSVANSSAMGLSSAQILKMGEVAKKASQALGWDMADAMDRLTKGIGKNRPQLLDELGIMINANTVYQDYARSVGKTAASLTDFEKKQAFANAALQQGIDKFSAIEIPTNPFNKLEASATNALNSILGLISQGIGPIVKYLAESPTGLLLAMTSIAAVLVKQAIPAIGSFRENAKRMAEEATEVANKRSKAASDAALGQAAATKAAAEISASAEQKILRDNLSKLEAIRASTKIGKDTKAYEILQKDPLKVTEEDLQHLDKQADKLQKRNAVAAEGYRQAVENIVLTKNATIARDEAVETYNKKLQASSSYFGIVATQQRIADKANTDAHIRRIGETASERVQSEGFLTAIKKGWGDLNAARKDFTTKAIDPSTGNEIEKLTKGTGNLRFAWEGLKLTAISAAQGVALLAASLSEVMMVIGIVITAYQIFDGFVSKATEQQSKFSDAVDEGTSAVKVASDAMEVLSKKSKSALSIESITAMTNAMISLIDSMDKQIDTINKWQKAAGWWDNTKDWVAGIFGKSNADVLAKSLGADIDAAFKTMIFTPGLADKTRQQLAELFHVDSKDLESLQDIQKVLASHENEPGFIALSKRATEIIAKAGEADKASTFAAQNFLDSMKQVDQEIDTITNKLDFKEGLGKLGANIEAMGIKMSQAMTNPLKSLEEILKLAQDPKLLGVLSTSETGGGLASGLVQALPQLKALQEETQKAAKAQIDAQQKIEDLKAKGAYTVGEKGPKTLIGEISDKNLEAAKAGVIEVAAKVQKQNETIFGPIRAEFNTVAKLMIETSLKDAQGKAELTVATAALASGQRAGLVTANEELALRLKDISYKDKELTASFNLSLNIIKNTEALEKANALAILASTSKEVTPEMKAAAGKTIEVISTAEQLRAGTEIKAGGRGPEGRGGVSRETLDQAEAYNLSTERLLAQLKAARASLEADATIALMKRNVDILTQRNALLQDGLKIQLAVTASELSGLAIDEKLAGAYTEANAENRKALEIQQANQNYSLQIAILAKQEIDLYTEKKNKNLEGYTQKVKELATQKILLETARDQAKEQALLNNILAKNTSIVSYQEQQANTRLQQLQTELALSMQQSDLETLRLTQLKEQGKISSNLFDIKTRESELSKLEQTFRVTEQADLDAINKAQLEYNNLLNRGKDLAQAKAEQSAKERGLDRPSQITQGQFARAETALGADVSSELLDKAAQTLKASQDKLMVDKGGVETARERIKLEATHKDILQQQANILANMTGLFGQIGTDIYNTAKAMLDWANSSEANNKVLATTQKTIADISAIQPAERSLAQQKQLNEAKLSEATLTKKSKEDEEKGITSVLSASKKLFSEQTVAYKVLDAAEKAHMALQLYDQGVALAGAMKTIASKIGLTEMWAAAEVAANAEVAAASIASNAVSVTASFPAIVAKFASQLGVPGLALAATVIAALGGAFNATKAPENWDAASMQKVQGTGAAGGAGTGAFGDSGAKSTAIKDSIDKLSDIAFDQYNLAKDETLSALLAIRDNIGTLAKTLYSVQGITSGSAFGTSEDSKSVLGGLFASSKTIADTGIKIVGSLSDLAKGAGSRQQYENVTSSSSMLFGLFSSTSYDTQSKDLQTNVNKIITDIFKSFSDVLTKQADFFGRTAEDTLNNIDIAAIQVSVSAKGLKGQEFADAVMAEIGIQLDAATSRAFPELVALQEQFGTFGESLSTFKDRVIKESKDFATATKLIGFNQLTTFTTKGVSQAAVDEYNAAKAAQAAAAVKPMNISFGYHEMGQAAYEKMQADNAQAVKNLADLQTANDRLAAAEKAYGTGRVTAIEQQIAAEQKLYKLFISATDTTGETSFTKAFNDYYNNYYTEAEKLAAKQAELGTQLSSLKLQPTSGVAPDGTGPVNPNAAQKSLSDTLKTKDDLKDFIKTLDITSDQVGKTISGMTDAEVLAKLLGLQQVFSDVVGSVAPVVKQLTELEIATAKLDQQIKIYDILNNSEASLALTRKKELEGLDARLRPTQQYIYALEDEAKIRNTLTTKLTSNISALKGFITNLTAARDQLVLGAQSTLTPSEKYAEAKKQLDALKSVIASTGADDASVLARNEALSKLPAATTGFLDASKTLYASSAQYTQDFSDATDYLKTTADKLGEAKTAAEQQLTESQTGNGFLQSIDLSVKSIPELVKLLSAASATTAGAAEASGIGAGSGKMLTENNKTVENLYKKLFGRSAEAEGLNYWTAKLDSGELTGESLKAVLQKYMPINNLKAEMTDDEVKSAILQGMKGDAQSTYDAVTSRGYTSKALADYLGLSQTEILSWATVNNLPTFAQGGLASGVSLVGEQGPELVDFKTPGRVYSNRASNDMFNNSELIAEIKALRDEVCKLREEQHEQTGHLIASNYDANNKASAKIANATENASTNAAWKDRSAVKIA